MTYKLIQWRPQGGGQRAKKNYLLKKNIYHVSTVNYGKQDVGTFYICLTRMHSFLKNEKELKIIVSLHKKILFLIFHTNEYLHTYIFFFQLIDPR